MKITEEMIDKDLRVLARLNKSKLAFRNDSTIRMVNSFYHRFIKGKPFTNKISYQQYYIERFGGDSIRVCVYGPLKPSPQREVGLMWIHGGGYATGVPETDFLFFEQFIEKTNCIVVCPDYTLSIDKPFPAALDDCYRTLLWMNDKAEMLGINPDWLMVGGDSAGGGLCAAVSLLARDRQEVEIKFQMPLYPMLDYRPTPSNTDNDAPVWDTKCNIKSWDLYLGERYPVSKYASPALEVDYTDLPETLTFVGTIEPFYDETRTYVYNLRRAGVKVHFKEYKGCFHAFDMYGINARVSKRARRFTLDGFCRAVSEVKHKYPLKSEKEKDEE